MYTQQHKRLLRELQLLQGCVVAEPRGSLRLLFEKMSRKRWLEEEHILGLKCKHYRTRSRKAGKRELEGTAAVAECSCQDRFGWEL